MWADRQLEEDDSGDKQGLRTCISNVKGSDGIDQSGHFVIAWNLVLGFSTYRGQAEWSKSSQPENTLVQHKEASRHTQLYVG